MVIWTCESCIYRSPSTRNKPPAGSTLRYVPCKLCCGYRIVRVRPRG